MSDNDLSQAAEALSQLSEVSRAVFLALEHGVEAALGMRADRDRDPWFFSHVVRRFALDHLEDYQTGHPGVFEVETLPGTGISMKAMTYHLRIFKKSGPGEEEFLRPTGHSKGRQAFYSQQIPIDWGSTWQPQPGQALNLVFAWEQSGGSTYLWLVCPDGFDGIWSPGECRWSIPVPHPATDMVVEYSEDNDDLLPLQLDETGSEDPEPDAV